MADIKALQGALVWEKAAHLYQIGLGKQLSRGVRLRLVLPMSRIGPIAKAKESPLRGLSIKGRGRTLMTVKYGKYGA